MKYLIHMILIGALTAMVSGCSSDGSSSSGGNLSQDASSCVTRTLRTVYFNDCAFDVNVIIFEVGQNFFLLRSDRSRTRSETGNSFGACRVPSEPVLNASSSGFSCT